MYEKLYNKLSILNLTKLVSELREIDKVIPVDKLVEKYSMILTCDGYISYAVEYFAYRYLYETEKDVIKSVNKMIEVSKGIFGMWSPDESEKLIMDIASDIEYKIEFNKRKFEVDMTTIINAKASLYEVISKETGLPVKVRVINYSYLSNNMAGLTKKGIVDIKFKNSKIQKYLDVIIEKDRYITRGEKPLLNNVMLSEDENKVEYKKLTDDVKSAMLKFGILKDVD